MLPDLKLSAAAILDFRRPLLTLDTPTLSTIAEVFSMNAPLIHEEHANVIFSLSVPRMEDLRSLRNRLTGETEYLFQSINYPIGMDKVITLPLWMIDYWILNHEVAAQQQSWTQARSWIMQQEHYKHIPQVIEALTKIPWLHSLPSSVGGGPSSDLALFCSQEWLSNNHMDLMMGLLQLKLDLRSTNTSAGIDLALRSDYANMIIKAYRFERETYLTSKSCTFLRNLASRINSEQVSSLCLTIGISHGDSREGSSLPADGGAICNHWIALVIDIKHRLLRYGDSMQNKPPPELCYIITWWMSTFDDGDAFVWESLASTKQPDSYSCSILAMDSLTHHYFPSRPLVENSISACVSARLDTFRDAVGYLCQLVRAF